MPAGTIDGMSTSSSLTLDRIAADFAASLASIDARSPQATNSRSGALFAAGIGPFPEAQAVRLVADELASATPYRDAVRCSVPYPNAPRQRCDLHIGSEPSAWVVEVKLLRLLGDNGRPNDNMLMHVLSPYAQHRSAVTDCDKLRSSSFACHRAVLIYAFDYDGLPMAPAVDAFEALARSRGPLGERISVPFRTPTHPVHQTGSVLAWQVL